MPLLLVSGILLPMSMAPTWLFIVSQFNPFVYVVDAARAAFPLQSLESRTSTPSGAGATSTQSPPLEL